MKKRNRSIRNAFDAHWFLYRHPKFKVQQRTEIEPEKADAMEKEGYIINRDPDGKCYRYWRHMHRHALDQNLDIFYTKTDKPGGGGRINDDKSKNKYVACWLEFGTLEYGFAYSGGKEPLGDWDVSTMLHNCHDCNLDCGAGTFDEALIKLAKLVLKHYGDYSHVDTERFEDCGEPECADCEQGLEVMDSLGLLVTQVKNPI
jgi:hypothetical protein